MPDSLRRAVPGRHNARPYRVELIRPPRSVRARIDGQWQTAVATCRMQPRDGAAWEVCLEYSPAPGQNGIAWFVEDTAHLRVGEADEQGPPKMDQVSDAQIPADLLALKRARIAATARLKALPQDAPSEERQRLRDEEMQAFRALMEHPAYHDTPWVMLEAAAREDEPGSSD